MPARRAMSAARSRTRATARRSARSSPPAAHELDAQRQVGRQRVDRPRSDVALVDEGGDDARQRVRPRRRSSGPAAGGRGARPSRRPSGVIAPSPSSAPSSVSSSLGLAPRLGRRGVEERQLVRRRAPRRQLEHQPGEVDLGDLGGAVGRPGAVLHPAPQAVGHARLEAAGPAGALVGRVAADRHRGEPGHAGADVEARRPGEPAVDDDATPSTVSDVSAMSVASTTRRRPGGDGASARSCSSSGEAPASGGRRRPARRRGERSAVAGDLADAGQEHEHVARSSSRSARRHGGGDGRLEAVVAARAAASGRRRGASGRRSRRPARPSACRAGGRTAAVSAVADMATMRRSGRSVAAASSVRARPRSVVRLRSWTSSKMTRPTPGSSGSCCRRRVSTPSVTHLDRASSGRCGARRGSGSRRARRPSVAGEVGHPPGRGAGGQPARLEHHDAPVAEPRLVEQGERDDRRLAGARRRGDDGPAARRRARRAASSRTSTIGRSGSVATGQPRAGDPWNGPGSPTIGMSGGRHAVAVGDRRRRRHATTARSTPRRRPAPCRRRG